LALIFIFQQSLNDFKMTDYQKMEKLEFNPEFVDTNKQIIIMECIVVFGSCYGFIYSVLVVYILNCSITSSTLRDIRRVP
jgi:hypothetical protein